LAADDFGLERHRACALSLLASLEHVVPGLGAGVLNLDQTEGESSAAGKAVGSVRQRLVLDIAERARGNPGDHRQNGDCA
jgi:hypothetical protein